MRKFVLTNNDSSVVTGSEKYGHEQPSYDETDVVGHHTAAETGQKEQTKENQHDSSSAKPDK